MFKIERNVDTGYCGGTSETAQRVVIKTHLKKDPGEVALMLVFDTQTNAHTDGLKMRMKPENENSKLKHEG